MTQVRIIFDKFVGIAWRVTHHNALGWPDERVNRITGRFQHRLFNNEKQGWQAGTLPRLKLGLAKLRNL